MARNTRLDHCPAELGELARAILAIIWSQGPLSAEQVRESLGRRHKDSTIRTILRRLEEKGYLSHSVDARTFVYRPTDSPQHVTGRAVQRIVDWMCGGSFETLLVGIIDSQVLNRGELKRLANHIAAVQRNDVPASGLKARSDHDSRNR